MRSMLIRLSAFPLTPTLSRGAFFCRGLALGGLLFAGGCIETAVLGTVPDGSVDEVPQLLPDAGRTPSDAGRVGEAGEAGKVCASNRDCADDGAFCLWPAGQCVGPGVCTPKPLACSPEVANVCACNQMTLATQCELERMGENVFGPAPCPAQPKIEGGADGHP